MAGRPRYVIDGVSNLGIGIDKNSRGESNYSMTDCDVNT